ncbi:MAG: hypothetical protein IIV78_04275 [Oscillospiraceae bacterium]|nr:hypothetical protein [Oscillospiraceae bacterium]
MKKRLVKGFAMLLALCMVFSLVACGGEEQPAGGEGEGAATAQKILKQSLSVAVTTLNPHTAQQSSDTTAVAYITSPLYGNYLNKETNRFKRGPILAAEEPIDVNGDGTVWQIKINENAQWVNGEPINADTFMYSWKMVLDPKLLSPRASDIADGAVKVVNATAYCTQDTTGVAVAWEDVGIKKIDDYTIEITLVGPYTQSEVMRHLGTVGSYPVYEPLYEAGMNAERTATSYGTEFEQSMSCGQFYLSDWIKGSEQVYMRNATWPHAELTKIDGVSMRVVEDNNTRIQMFESGDLDTVGLSAESMKQYMEDPRLRKSTSHNVHHLDINYDHTEYPILANINFRKALFYGTDRVTIANLTNNYPINYLIPDLGISYADGTAFRDLPIAQEYLGENFDYDPELALEYFNKAWEEEGMSGKLTLSLLYGNDLASVVTTAQFLQEAWPAIFGEDRFGIELEGMPYQQSLDQKKSVKTNPNAYELTLSRWNMSTGADNPIRYLQGYVSTYARRNGNYRCDVLDEMYELAKTTEVRMDEVKLAEVTAAAEKAALDTVTVVPIFQDSSFSLTGDRLILPFEEEDPKLGWGLKYSDLRVD